VRLNKKNDSFSKKEDITRVEVARATAHPASPKGGTAQRE
jgi:hypothetical protein